MATKEELIQRVGEELALVPVGQALEDTDVLRIQSTYTEVYKRVEAKGYATWRFDGEIPDKVMPYLSLLVEEKLLTAYSVPDNRYQRIKQDAGPNGTLALNDLAEITQPEYDSVEGATDY